MFIDTGGEMTFENRERLNFIMHFMKKGAVEQVATKKGGGFIRKDAELSFSGIWLPCAQNKQAEIDQLKSECTLHRDRVRIAKDLIEAKDKEIEELESEWLEMHNDNKQVNKDAMDSEKELYTLKKLMVEKDKRIKELEGMLNEPK